MRASGGRAHHGVFDARVPQLGLAAWAVGETEGDGWAGPLPLDEVLHAAGVKHVPALHLQGRGRQQQ